MAEEIEKVEERVNKHDERMRDIELNIVGMSKDSEMFTSTLGRFANILDKFDGSLNRLDSTMGGIQVQLVTLSNKVDGQDCSIQLLGSKVDSLEDKGKIDWQLLVKNNFGKIIMFFILMCLAYPKVAEIFMSVFA